MILFDVNVLIGAMRRDSVHHASATEYLRKAMEDRTSIAWNGQLYVGLVRILTQKSFPGGHSELEECIAFLEFIRALPATVPIVEGPLHWQIATRLLAETNFVGRKVTDVFIAALAIENRAKVATFDRDFLQFKGLNVDVLMDKPLQP
jgi:toxin-antitoxin system PIN domain toxin